MSSACRTAGEGFAIPSFDVVPREEVERAASKKTATPTSMRALYETFYIGFSDLKYLRDLSTLSGRTLL
jgi:hypothetical protein